jgi:hypothetical protein
LLTSDGHRSYIVAVDETFGDDVDYATLQKLYGADPEPTFGRTARDVLQFRPHPSDAQSHTAMAASVTDRLWEMKDPVEMLEASETRSKRAA